MMDGVGTFSMIKRVTFRLSQFRLNYQSGSLFGCQKGTFSIDKNILSGNYSGMVVSVAGWGSFHAPF